METYLKIEITMSDSNLIFDRFQMNQIQKAKLNQVNNLVAWVVSWEGKISTRKIEIHSKDNQTKY